MSKTATSKVFGGLDNSLSTEHAKLLTNGSFLKLCTFVPNNDFFSLKYNLSKLLRIFVLFYVMLLLSPWKLFLYVLKYEPLLFLFIFNIFAPSDIWHCFFSDTWNIQYIQYTEEQKRAFQSFILCIWEIQYLASFVASCSPSQSAPSPWPCTIRLSVWYWFYYFVL